MLGKRPHGKQETGDNGEVAWHERYLQEKRKWRKSIQRIWMFFGAYMPQPWHFSLFRCRVWQTGSKRSAEQCKNMGRYLKNAERS